MASSREKKRRSRGSGGIVRLASGNYAYQYVDASGTRRTQTLRTKNRKEAEAKAVEFETAVAAKDKEEVLLQQARARKIINTRNLPFPDVWQAFLDTSPTAGRGTLGLYERALEEFVSWLSTERPSITSLPQVDLETAIAYMEHVWQSGVSASTYNDKRNALGLITKRLANRYGIDVNPWPRTERMRGAVQQKRLPLTREQAQALLKRLDERPEPFLAELLKRDRRSLPSVAAELLKLDGPSLPPLLAEIVEVLGTRSPTAVLTELKAKLDMAAVHEDPEMRCLVLLGLYAGMRLGDAVLLKRSCVNLAGGRIDYTPGKTARTSGAVARLPILPPLAEALKALPDGNDEYLLPGVAARYRSNPDGVKVPLVRLIHAITGGGRQKSAAQCLRERSMYGYHSLRHTFATEAARAGVPVVYLQLMTGDTLQTLQKYYVRVGLQETSVPGFESMPRLLDPNPTDGEPERAELRALIENLPVAKVRELLSLARSSASTPQLTA